MQQNQNQSDDSCKTTLETVQIDQKTAQNTMEISDINAIATPTQSNGAINLNEVINSEKPKESNEDVEMKDHTTASIQQDQQPSQSSTSVPVATPRLKIPL